MDKPHSRELGAKKTQPGAGGMLPICSSCKKIRGDKGYWEQIETYISAHTDTLFSHGMCPDCVKKAYEELEKLKNEDSPPLIATSAFFFLLFIMLIEKFRFVLDFTNSILTQQSPVLPFEKPVNVTIQLRVEDTTDSGQAGMTARGTITRVLSFPLVGNPSLNDILCPP